MDNLRENFRNWLTKQGLSEKTETGRPSTIYDYLTTIKRICKKEGYITWEELAINLFSISSNYQGKYKTVLHKYNAFLFEAELSKRVSFLFRERVTDILLYRRNSTHNYCISSKVHLYFLLLKL